MTKQKNNIRSVNDLMFVTTPRWKRIGLTLLEFVCVLAVLFMFCYALHLVEVITQ